MLIFWGPLLVTVGEGEIVDIHYFFSARGCGTKLTLLVEGKDTERGAFQTLLDFCLLPRIVMHPEI